MKVLQCSVTSRRRDSGGRDREAAKPRPLLIAARVRLPEGELTLLGLLTEREGVRRYA